MKKTETNLFPIGIIIEIERIYWILLVKQTILIREG